MAATWKGRIFADNANEEKKHKQLFRGRYQASTNNGTTAKIADSLLKKMAPFDLDACIQQLLRKQLLHEALLREICEKTKEVLMRESNVVHVSAPVTVVGDIHG